MIKTIIFDMYGVIIKESKGNFIPFVYKHFPNTDRGILVRHFDNAGVGGITSKELFVKVGFQGDINTFETDYLDNYLTYDAGFTTAAHELKRKFRLSILSNDVSEWSRYLTKKHRIGEHINISVISGDVQCRKPDRKIFELMLDRLNQPAEECLFIDNSVKNLRTAEELGMGTILFNRDNEKYDGMCVYSFKELVDLLQHFEGGA